VRRDLGVVGHDLGEALGEGKGDAVDELEEAKVGVAA
jgi:hypothetical protein